MYNLARALLVRAWQVIDILLVAKLSLDKTDPLGRFSSHQVKNYNYRLSGGKMTLVDRWTGGTGVTDDTGEADRPVDLWTMNRSTGKTGGSVGPVTDASVVHRHLCMPGCEWVGVGVWG